RVRPAASGGEPGARQGGAERRGRRAGPGGGAARGAGRRQPDASAHRRGAGLLHRAGAVRRAALRLRLPLGSRRVLRERACPRRPQGSTGGSAQGPQGGRTRSEVRESPWGSSRATSRPQSVRVAKVPSVVMSRAPGQVELGTPPQDQANQPTPRRAVASRKGEESKRNVGHSRME